MPITQKDIALHLGISRRLVGYALKDHSRVSPQTRQLVHDTARELGYQPNLTAQALKTGRTYQIALCFPILGGSFYTEIIRRVEELTQPTPYDLLITTFDPMNPKQRNKQFAVDAMIFVGPTSLIPAQANYPVVAIQTQMYGQPNAEEDRYDRVEIEIQTACIEAMQHLISQKFQRIAYVTTTHMMQPTELRYRTYCQEIQSAGLTPEIVKLPIVGETRVRRQSQQMLHDYFSTNGFPDALYCGNDDLATGACRALRRLDRQIPQQTAVLGFDDSDDSEYLVPPLTSVRLPLEDVCERAFGMLVTRMEDREMPPQHETYHAKLNIRESTIVERTG